MGLTDLERNMVAPIIASQGKNAGGLRASKPDHCSGDSQYIWRIASSLLQEEPELSLECLCADDFGAGRVPPNDRSKEDRERLSVFRSTLRKHEKLEVEARSLGLRVHVQRNPDRDSDHSDAYLYFTVKQLEVVMVLLKKLRLPGDILDVPESVPEDVFQLLVKRTPWQVQRSN